MNETMELLTIVMTVMMPLTVITSFYGMNIQLPMQDHPMASMIIFIVMISIIILMLMIFRRQGLIGSL
jgi:magnesium transporter